MTQRDTLLPLCKVVSITDNALSSINLTRTALELQSVSIADPSGFALGSSTTLTVSSTGPEDASATIKVVVKQTSTTTSSTTASVVNKGSYTSDTSAFGVSGMGTITSMNSLGASGTFTLNVTIPEVEVPYITVTDLSGSEGWFRIAPASSVGTPLYASGGATKLVVGDASGYPGIVGNAGATIVLTLQPGQMVTAVEIENQLNTVSDFAINYGVIKQANPLRDNNIPNVR